MSSTSALTKRAARAKLRALGITIPFPFDIDELCRRVAEARGRPIRVVAVELPPRATSCGAWFARESDDIIAHDRAAPAPLREHTILHELGHIIFDHGGAPVAEHVEQYGLHLDPSLVRRMLQRTLYDSNDEREAELFASAIGSRVRRRQPQSPPPDDHTLRVIQGLAAVMGEGSQ
jgi:Zn-dependent peptidase ImmA (M78 family)